jgi:hypothetical protein
MQKCKRIVRAVFLYGLSLTLVAGYPLVALADSPPVDTTTTPAVVAPAPAPTYNYNPATQHWDSNLWQYNPTTGHYDAVAPAPAATTPEVGSAADDQAPAAVNEPTTSDKTATDAASQTATNSTITNNIGANSQTGSADVLNNTTAGNATTGNASALATLTNVVNSAVNTGGGSGPATFVQNITGNVYGDIMLYPAMLAAMLQQPGNSSATPTDVAVSNTNGIVNNVNLNAASGDATVAHNTTAGNATTGSANAVASVMNIINSIVAANKSFIGTVNIYGNLEGDILVAPDFIPQLLASNADADHPTTIDSTNTTGIANNVNLAATSGTATVDKNTSAGNATTGTAGTNLVVLNLTGQKVVASNSLLVFVNVLGTWVGMIVNAPAGATAAELGSGVTGNVSAPESLTTTTNNQITNNIDLTAQSGNAAVSGNTHAGNATTGNATASAMILNLANSSLGLADWFGVLFINVFGSWNGSFGVDTASGNPPAAESSAPSSAVPQAIAFVAHASDSSRVLVPRLPSSIVEEEPAVAADPPAVLGTTSAVKNTTHTPKVTAAKPFPLIAAILAGLGLAGATWWRVAATRR